MGESLSAVFALFPPLSLSGGPEQQGGGGQDGQDDNHDQQPEDAAAIRGGAGLVGLRLGGLITQDDGGLGGLGRRGQGLHREGGQSGGLGVHRNRGRLGVHRNRGGLRNPEGLLGGLRRRLGGLGGYIGGGGGGAT